MSTSSVAMHTQQSPPIADSPSSLEDGLYEAMMYLTKMVIATQRADQNKARMNAVKDREKLSRHHYDQFPHLRDQTSEAVRETTSNFQKSKARLDQLADGLRPVAQGLATAINTSSVATVSNSDFQEHLAEFKMLKKRYSELEQGLGTAHAESATLKVQLEQAERVANEKQKLSETMRREITDMSQKFTHLQDSARKVSEESQQKIERLQSDLSNYREMIGMCFQKSQQNVEQLQHEFIDFKKLTEESARKSGQSIQELKDSWRVHQEFLQKTYNDATAQSQRDKNAIQNRIAGMEAYSDKLTKGLDEGRIEVNAFQRRLDAVTVTVQTMSYRCDRIHGDIKDLKAGADSSGPRIGLLGDNLSALQEEMKKLMVNNTSSTELSTKYTELHERIVRIENGFREFRDMTDDRDEHVQLLITELKPIAATSEDCRNGLFRLESKLNSIAGPPVGAGASRKEQSGQHRNTSNSAALMVANRSPFSPAPTITTSVEDVRALIDGALASYPKTSSFQAILTDMRSSFGELLNSAASQAKANLMSEIVPIRGQILALDSHAGETQQKIFNLDRYVLDMTNRFHAKLVSEARELQKTKIEFQEMQIKIDEIVADVRLKYEMLAKANPDQIGQKSTNEATL